MPVKLEFINLIVRIDRIQQKYPGGIEACLVDHEDELGRIAWHDEVLFRTGAMSPHDMGSLVEFWEFKGLTGARDCDGQMHWIDFCVVDGMFGPTLICPWLEFTKHGDAKLFGSRSEVVVGRPTNHKEIEKLRQNGQMANIDKAWEFVNNTAYRLAPHSRALNSLELIWAQNSEVQNPISVRVVEVDQMPFPIDADLANAAKKLRFLGPATVGFTFKNLIVVLKGYYSEELMRHELRHCQQWQGAASPISFLHEYINQIYNEGYDSCAFERDARAFSFKQFPTA